METERVERLRLPPWLCGSYLMYKKDTTRAIEWLKETGHPLLPPITKSKRSDDISELKLLQKYAEAIANSSTIPVIPTDIELCLERAIINRVQVGQWYEEQHEQGHTHVESLARHEFFLSVFKSIVKTLRPKFHTILDADGPSLCCAAHGLHTDDVLEANEESPNEPLSQIPQDLEESHSPVEQLLCNADLYTAANDLFLELSRIRTYIIHLWENMGVQGLDLITATLVTETALDQLYRAVLSFTAAIEPLDFCGLTSYEAAAGCLFTAAHGLEYFNNIKDGKTEEFLDESRIKLSRSLCIPTHSLLLEQQGRNLRKDKQRFKNRGAPGEGLPLPHFKLTNAEQLRYHGLRDAMTADKLLKEDRLLLRDMIISITMLSTEHPSFVARDHVSREFMKVHIPERPAIWTVFMAQIYLDIIDKWRGGGMDGGFSVLKERSDLQIASCKRYLDIMRRDDHWKVNRRLEHTRPIEELMVRLETTSTAAFQGKLDLLKYNPLLCGVLVFQNVILMQEVTQKAVMEWGYLESVAHLFKLTTHTMREWEKHRLNRYCRPTVQIPVQSSQEAPEALNNSGDSEASHTSKDRPRPLWPCGLDEYINHIRDDIRQLNAASNIQAFMAARVDPSLCGLISGRSTSLKISPSFSRLYACFMARYKCSDPGLKLEDLVSRFEIRSIIDESNSVWISGIATTASETQNQDDKLLEDLEEILSFDEKCIVGRREDFVRDYDYLAMHTNAEMILRKLDEEIGAYARRNLINISFPKLSGKLYAGEAFRAFWEAAGPDNDEALLEFVAQQIYEELLRRMDWEAGDDKPDNILEGIYLALI